MTQRNFDFVVIGSGMAGLTFALKVAAFGSVAGGYPPFVIARPINPWCAARFA